jgi:type I restriction enzyme S subunit
MKIPDLPTQSRIASVLSAYDDLIENNEKRIKALEEMAQRLYTEWFVKFKFPGHEKTPLVDSGTEYGMIPDGWEVSRLDQIAKINSETLKKPHESQIINYIDIASVSTSKIDVIQPMSFSEAPSRARRLVRHGDILWSTVRPNRKSYCLVINPMHNLVASTGFAVIRSDKIPYTYLYQSLTTEAFVGYLVNHAQGAAYPSVKGEDFERSVILLPTKILLDKFHNATLDLYEEKEKLRESNICFQKIRDLLIPQLVTGKQTLKA